MYFENWAEFIRMGGHGAYVWSAYALTILVVIYNLLAPFLARRQAFREISRLHRITTNSHERHCHGNKKPSGTAEVMNESGS